MEKKDIPRILDGLKKRLTGRKSDISPFKFMKSKNNIKLYTDDIFDDYTYTPVSNYHIFLFNMGPLLCIDDFKKYDRLTVQEQVDFICEIAKLLKYKFVWLEVGTTKFAEVLMRQFVYDILNGKQIKLVKYGFTYNGEIPKIDKQLMIKYANDLLKILEKNEDTYVYYAHRYDDTIKYKFSDKRIKSLISFCKAVLAWNIKKIEELLFINQRTLPKIIKDTKKYSFLGHNKIFKNNAFDGIRRMYTADESFFIEIV